MAGKKQTQDFEGRFFDQLDDNFKDLKDAIKDTRTELRANTKTTEEGFKVLNGRVKDVEDKVFGESKATIKDLPPWWRDPALVKLATMVAAIVLILLGAKEILGSFTQ